MRVSILRQVQECGVCVDEGGVVCGVRSLECACCYCVFVFVCVCRQRQRIQAFIFQV